jgi:hypothetical protein
MRHVVALFGIVLVLGVAVPTATATPGYGVQIGGNAQIQPNGQLYVSIRYRCPESVGASFIYLTVVQDPQQATTTSLQGAPCTGKAETVTVPVDPAAFPWAAGRAMAAASVFAAGATQDIQYRKILISA